MIQNRYTTRFLRLERYMFKSASQNILKHVSLAVLTKHVEQIYSIMWGVSKLICNTLSSTWAVYVKVGATKHFKRESRTFLTYQVQHLNTSSTRQHKLNNLASFKQMCNMLSSTWSVYVKVCVTKHFKTLTTSSTYKASSTNVLNNVMSIKIHMQRTFVDLSDIC